MKRLAAVLACWTGAVLAQGLVWENRNVEFKARPGDTSATVEFPFENKGKRTVRILRVRTTCSCTAAVPDKEVYAPGEKGKVVSTFRFEGRTGRQLTTVRVVTDDPKEPVVVLQIGGMLPWNVQLSDRLLVWDLGGEATPKEVLVEMNPDVEIALAKVQVDDATFACAFAPTDVPRQYRVVFTPRATAKLARGIASLVTKPALNDAESARCRIFLYVK